MQALSPTIKLLKTYLYLSTFGLLLFILMMTLLDIKYKCFQLLYTIIIYII